MNKIMDWFKKNSNNKVFFIVILFAIAIDKIAELIVSNVYTAFFTVNLFSLSSIDNEMIFCLHQTIIISTFLTIILALLFDKYVLKEMYGDIFRRIFFGMIFIMLVSAIIGHYNVIYGTIPYTAETFHFFKPGICY